MLEYRYSTEILPVVSAFIGITVLEACSLPLYAGVECIFNGLVMFVANLLKINRSECSPQSIGILRTVRSVRIKLLGKKPDLENYH